MRITIILPPSPAQPVGHYQTHYWYANELAALGHEVTLVVGIPSWWIGRIKEIPPEYRYRTNEEDWFRLRPDVRRLHMVLFGPDDLPPADAIIALVHYLPDDELYPLDRGVNFLIANAYAQLCTEEVQLRTWRLAGWKVMNARWLRQKATENGIEEWETEYVPNGVDASTFRVVRPITERPPRVSFVNAWNPLKGTRFAIAALEKARAARSQLEAIAFGYGARPKELPSWVEYRRAVTRSELVHEVYNGSSIFICPGVREGHNNPAL